MRGDAVFLGEQFPIVPSPSVSRLSHYLYVHRQQVIVSPEVAMACNLNIVSNLCSLTEEY